MDEDVSLVDVYGIETKLLQALSERRWSRQFRTNLAIHGRHAAVFAVGASEAAGTLVGMKVGRSTFTAWPLCANGQCPILVVFRYNALCRLDAYFVEELDRFLDWVDLPYTGPGQREYVFVSHAMLKLRAEAVKNGNEIAQGIKTSYSLRVLEVLPTPLL